MLGTPFAGFAGDAGTEQVAQRLSTTPAAGENPSLCYSTGECIQATQLCLLLPLPCPCPAFSRAAHLHCWHCTLPPSVQEAHGDAHGTDGCSDTSACTGTHAHHGTRILPAAQPQPPNSPSLEPVALNTGLWQTAGALPAACGSLGVLAANMEDAGVPHTEECPARGGQCWQLFLLQDHPWVPATLPRSQSAHLPTSLNQGKRS